MQEVTAAFIFLGIYVASLYGAYWLKAKYLPAGFTASRIILRIVGFGIAFLGILCLMLWGFNPTPITIGANNIVLNPFRWFWWFIGAVLLGTAEGFISDARGEKLISQTKVTPPLPRPTNAPTNTDV